MSLSLQDPPPPPPPEDLDLFPGRFRLSRWGHVVVWGPLLVFTPLACNRGVGPAGAMAALIVWMIAAILIIGTYCTARVKRLTRQVLPMLSQGELSKARQQLLDRIHALADLGPQRLPMVWTLAWVEFARGDLNSALRTFGVVPLYRGYTGNIASATPAVLALLFALKGDLSAAKAWLRSAEHDAGKAGKSARAMARMALSCREQRWPDALTEYAAHWPSHPLGIPPPISWLPEALARFAQHTLGMDRNPVAPAIPGVPMPAGAALFAATEWPDLDAYLRQSPPGSGTPTGRDA